MKTATLMVMVLLGFGAGRAQPYPGGRVDASALKPEAQKTNAAPALLSKPAATGTILGKPVQYKGLLVEAATSTNVLKMLSLRKPVNPAEDLENVVFYPGTERVQGIRLFSIQF